MTDIILGGLLVTLLPHWILTLSIMASTYLGTMYEANDSGVPCGYIAGIVKNSPTTSVYLLI